MSSESHRLYVQWGDELILFTCDASFQNQEKLSENKATHKLAAPVYALLCSPSRNIRHPNKLKMQDIACSRRISKPIPAQTHDNVWKLLANFMNALLHFFSWAWELWFSTERKDVVDYQEMEENEFRMVEVFEMELRPFSCTGAPDQ